MTAPTAATRGTPTAWKIDQGYRILVANSANLAINLWEIEVTPSGADGGDAIQTSTQLTQRWHTKRPRKLINNEGAKLKFQLAAGSKAEITALINVEATITEIYPDGSTYAYYGYYKSVKFGTFKEGEKPTGDLEIVETDWDYINGVEAGPVFTPAYGTAG